MDIARLLLDASEEILILVDAQTLTIVGANRCTLELLGHTEASLIGLPIGDIECALSDLFSWEEMRNQGGCEEIEGAYRCADGSILDVTKTTRPAGENANLFVVRALPLGQRQRIAEALDDMGSRLSATLEATADGILLVDNEDSILNMNRRFSEMWGLPQTLLDSRDDAEIIRYMAQQIRPLQYSAPISPIHARDADDNAFDTLHLQNGRVLELSSLPARSGAQTLGRVHSYRDVTERYLAQQELIAARDEAKRANHAKTRFLATMSHEIRTPMNGILGMGQMLMMPGIDESERREYARVILASGKTLLALLNDILDLSKVEAGKMDLSEVVFTPSQLLNEMACLMIEPATTKGLQLTSIWHGDSNARYRGDSIRIRQMLTNYIANGIKFTDRGSILVEGVELERHDATAQLEFSVTDTGIGVDQHVQEFLFQPFSQVDASATRRFSGTGLGLSIVRSLAALMKGSAGVSSLPGEGSRFWFRVELEAIDSAADARQVSRNGTPGGGAETTRNAADTRILVVEDNAVNRTILETVLKKHGYPFALAMDGAQAVDLIKSGKDFDAVLMDCQMPVMDGYEATRQIRQWEAAQGRHIPIIAITGDSFAADRERCLAAGMDDFLSKPVNFDVLIALLKKWLGHRQP